MNTFIKHRKEVLTIQILYPLQAAIVTKSLMMMEVQQNNVFTVIHYDFKISLTPAISDADQILPSSLFGEHLIFWLFAFGTSNALDY